MSQLDKAHQTLRGVRERTDLTLRPTRHLKTTFTDFSGQEQPLKVRYYQVQGILHLVVMRRFLLGDDTGLGKTLEAIAALCYIWESDPDRKVIILTTKSSVEQWAAEFGKFTTGVKVIVNKGTPKKREDARRRFTAATGPTVLVGGYRAMVQDFRHIQNWQDFVLITDEATAYKNPETQVHQVCRHLSAVADRTWALTATLIKNNLMEGFGIYQVVVPGLFQMSYNQFMLYYCLTRMQPIPRSNRQIPVIVGYLPQKIEEFKEVIDPYFLGRPKHKVATELPVVVMRNVTVGLTPFQEEKYEEALEGILELGDGEMRETTKLTSIIYCQQIVNHPELIQVEDAKSPKLEMLVDLIKDGDFADENVIVFSRFKKMINLIMPRLKAEKIKAVRVTGDENETQRSKAMADFQNPDAPERVICITAAGAESINLQAAKVIICYDTPWSAGDFLQLIGRMVRIGSVHDRCYVLHLVAKGQKQTIDHRVMDVLGKKMKLVEAVLGKRLKGEADEGMIAAENEISDLFTALRNDARGVK